MVPQVSNDGAPLDAHDPVPDHLVQQIADGRCVAFVGAGFAAPAAPAWRALLRGLAERADLDGPTAAWFADLVEGGSARDLEAAAQVLSGRMGDRFDPALHEVLLPTVPGVH